MSKSKWLITSKRFDSQHFNIQTFLLSCIVHQTQIKNLEIFKLFQLIFHYLKWNSTSAAKEPHTTMLWDLIVFQRAPKKIDLWQSRPKAALPFTNEAIFEESFLKCHLKWFLNAPTWYKNPYERSSFTCNANVVSNKHWSANSPPEIF